MSKYIIDIEDRDWDAPYDSDKASGLIFSKEGLRRLRGIRQVKAEGDYYHIMEDFEIYLTADTGTEIDRMRKEVGNYFRTYERAEHVRDRMLQFLHGGIKQ